MELKIKVMMLPLEIDLYQFIALLCCCRPFEHVIWMTKLVSRLWTFNWGYSLQLVAIYYHLIGLVINDVLLSVFDSSVYQWFVNYTFLLKRLN